MEGDTTDAGCDTQCSLFADLIVAVGMAWHGDKLQILLAGIASLFAKGGL